jgi:hypothetical protein
LPASNPVHLDLKVTSDFVLMRGRGGGGPKIAALSLSCAQHGGDNPSFEWKWKQVEAPGPRVGLI